MLGWPAHVNHAAVHPARFKGQNRRELHLLSRKHLSYRDKNNKVVPSTKAGSDGTAGVCWCNRRQNGSKGLDFLGIFEGNVENLHLYFLGCSSRDVPACSGCNETL